MRLREPNIDVFLVSPSHRPRVGWRIDTLVVSHAILGRVENIGSVDAWNRGRTGDRRFAGRVLVGAIDFDRTLLTDFLPNANAREGFGLWGWRAGCAGHGRA